MAERVRFELTVELPLHNISNVAPSTTRPSLHERFCNIIRFDPFFKPGFRFFNKKLPDQPQNIANLYRRTQKTFHFELRPETASIKHIPDRGRAGKCPSPHLSELISADRGTGSGRSRNNRLFRSKSPGRRSGSDRVSAVPERCLWSKCNCSAPTRHAPAGRPPSGR